MNLWIRSCLAASAVLCSVALPLTVAADDEKVQTITFVEDDAQKYMGTKIYELKHTKAADIMPFMKDAVLRYTGASSVSSVNDPANKRQLIIVSTGRNFFPYADAIIAALDRPAKMNRFDTNILGDGIMMGFYRAQFRGTPDMLAAIRQGDIFGGWADALIKWDAGSGLFYFKDSPSNVAAIKDVLSWFDKPIPQTRLEMTVYEVRDSDLMDLGIDYLAWKNGPGLNLFAAGYDVLTMKVGETLINSLADKGVDLIGSFNYGFGGFYTAPAFDMSFIRILQQNGKATISSTASVVVTNQPDNGAAREYNVTFAPEYQNITKDGDHRSDVVASTDADGNSNATLSAVVSNAVITAGAKGVVNFEIELQSKNAVERNNLGAEIFDTASVTAAASLAQNQEKVLTSWERVSKVEQTIGIPFLCELPILKYIFGTTTSNMEKTYYYVTVKAVPVQYNEDVKTGVMTEFDELCKK